MKIPWDILIVVIIWLFIIMVNFLSKMGRRKPQAGPGPGPQPPPPQQPQAQPAPRRELARELQDILGAPDEAQRRQQQRRLQEAQRRTPPTPQEAQRQRPPTLQEAPLPTARAAPQRPQRPTQPPPRPAPPRRPTGRGGSGRGVEDEVSRMEQDSARIDKLVREHMDDHGLGSLGKGIRHGPQPVPPVKATPGGARSRLKLTREGFISGIIWAQILGKPGGLEERELY